mmetsp:Transcript_7611/g.22821  ORF Transcript_7611/g.22821 Transcript_7611/m.22821 type:complete len:376 (+) Transcript_7611:286-1413(+)
MTPAASLTIDDVMSFLESAVSRQNALSEAEEPWGHELLSQVHSGRSGCIGGGGLHDVFAAPDANTGGQGGAPAGTSSASDVLGVPAAYVPGAAAEQRLSTGVLAPQVQHNSSPFALISPPQAISTPGASPVPLVLPTNDPTVPKKKMSKGNSHICTMPGCGKGFASRWSLERHMKNHGNQDLDDVEDADSFVERRLRERLRAAETALNKTKERLLNAQAHHGEIRSEIQTRVASSAEMEDELRALILSNTELARRLSAANPDALREIAEACVRGEGLILCTSVSPSKASPKGSPGRGSPRKGSPQCSASGCGQTEQVTAPLLAVTDSERPSQAASAAQFVSRVPGLDLGPSVTGKRRGSPHAESSPDAKKTTRGN